VQLADGCVAQVGRCLERRRGEPCSTPRAGAPAGLHDHLHLFALAAALSSVRCGPPSVCDAAALARALAQCPPSGDSEGWIRGVGYFESVAGELDRARLDRLVPARPLRIQHRSGALWMLNSAAVVELGLDRGTDAPGVERDAAGRATGRLFHLDAWLRDRLERAAPPGLAGVGALLSSFGVTGVTDATPGNGPAELRALVGASDRGQLRQRVLVMGTPGLPVPAHALIERGAVKLRLDESALPDFDEFVSRVDQAHRGARAVAIHCVTRAELVLAAGALQAAGTLPGDRIEHAA
jgi:predicted amidohydrolase YtcJ